MLTTLGFTKCVLRINIKLQLIDHTFIGIITLIFLRKTHLTDITWDSKYSSAKWGIMLARYICQSCSVAKKHICPIIETTLSIKQFSFMPSYWPNIQIYSGWALHANNFLGNNLRQ